MKKPQAKLKVLYITANHNDVISTKSTTHTTNLCIREGMTQHIPHITKKTSKSAAVIQT
jgi:hypothetical protein